jgi:DNA polymerase I-like protein with 3'-5' exonuclease and polymerase domains/intein/homing endonuclease
MKEYHIISTIEDLEELDKYIDEFPANAPMGIDTETDGLRFFAYDCGISLSLDPDMGFYLVTRTWNGKELIVSPIRDHLKPYLEKWLLKERRLVLHNALFDARILQNNFGIYIVDKILMDTRTLFKLTISEDDNASLKELSEKYIDNGAKNEQLDLKESVLRAGGRWNKYEKDMFMGNTEILGRYACKDASLTLAIYNKFIPLLEADNQLNALWQNEQRPLLEVVFKMNTTGFPVDIPYFEKLKRDMESDIARLESEILNDIKPLIEDYEDHLIVKKTKYARDEYAKMLCKAQGWDIRHLDDDQIVFIKKSVYRHYYGEITPFKLTSLKDMTWLIFEKLGEPVTKKTEMGKPSIDGDVIEALSAKYPWANKLLEKKKNEKLLSTYVECVLNEHIDGLVYLDFDICGTISGRFSTHGGVPIMTLPAENTAIKQGFIAPKGYKLVSADASSLEPHLAAYLSGDPKLIDSFVSGKDFYSVIGMEQFGKKDCTPYKDGSSNSFAKKYSKIRDLCKTYCFAKNTKVDTKYGIKFIKDLNIGDYILTSKGYKRITHIFKRKADTIRFCTTKSGFECTADHEIWSETELKFKKAIDFIKDEKLSYFVSKSNNYNKEYLKLPIFSNASFNNGAITPLSYLDFSPEWAWILGAYIGDGVGAFTRRKTYRKKMFNSHLTTGYIGICGLSDDLITEKFRKFFQDKGYKFSRVWSNKGKPNEFSIDKISDYELIKIFQGTFKAFESKDELTGRKNLTIQDFVFNSSFEVKLAFIAGLLDTDGYLKSYGKRRTAEVTFCSKSINLVSDLSCLLHSIGVECSIYTELNKTYNKYYHILRISAKGVQVLAFLGIDKYLTVPRKKQAILDTKDIIIRGPTKLSMECKFRKIVPSENQDVYDITVEDIHEFYANGIRVHNCLASLYGAENHRISEVLHPEAVDWETRQEYKKEAQDLLDGYFKAFPGIKKLIDESHKEAHLTGQVRTKFGRIRHMPLVKEVYDKYGFKLKDYRFAKNHGLQELRRTYKNYLNNSVNVQIQGLGAHILNVAAINIYKKINELKLDAWISIQVHDELICIAKEDQAEQVLNIMKECISNAVDLKPIVIKSEGKIGNNLKECK